jgi:hypothetical protein
VPNKVVEVFVTLQMVAISVFCEQFTYTDQVQLLFVFFVVRCCPKKWWPHMTNGLSRNKKCSGSLIQQETKLTLLLQLHLHRSHFSWRSDYTKHKFCVARHEFKKFKAFIFLKCTQWQRILSYNNSTAMDKFLKTLHPSGIWTQDLLFCRRTRRPLCHAARAVKNFV